MRRIATGLVLGAAAAATLGCTAGRLTASEAADRAALAEARAVGEPEQCVTLISIRDTKVRDDRTIDFFLRDGRVLRNHLPNRCPGLGFDESFSYSTSTGQLCSVDTIRVHNASGIQGAACGLGMFQPVELPPRL